MHLRTYRASTMAEALADVKRDLGRDAVILHTRSFRKGGLLGFIGGRPMWEVTAAPNVNVLRRAAKGEYVSEARDGGRARTNRADAHEVPRDGPAARAGLTEAGAASRSPEADESRAPAGAAALDRQVSEIRSMVEKLLFTQVAGLESDLPAELRAVLEHLLQQDVDEQCARELVNQLRLNLTGRELSDRRLIRERLGEVVAARIPTVGAAEGQAGATGRRVMAFIGPTGVGKTTTIAKLAANFKLREGKKVALITIDTYRIAAVDQLRTYADIIEVPLQTVLTPAELQQAVQSVAEMDVVLIDTAGRSQKNQLRLNQLRGFLAAASADEVHLVVSATANRRCARGTLEQFSGMGVNRIILTKLDEAESFGVILTAAAAGKAALSYVTTGQDVPDDIAPADAVRLARSILEGSMRPCQ